MVKTLEELNTKAEELFNKGDKKGLKELAKENGLDTYLAEAYANGELPILCPDTATLACGRLELEAAKESMVELAQGIAEYLEQQVQEDEELAKGIIAKPLKDLCNKVYAEAKQRKKGNCVYIPPFEVFQMAKAYYLD